MSDNLEVYRRSLRWRCMTVPSHETPSGALQKDNTREYPVFNSADLECGVPWNGISVVLSFHRLSVNIRVVAIWTLDSFFSLCQFYTMEILIIDFKIMCLDL